MTKSKYEKDYLEADKYVVINDRDPDLKPIVLSLPKPPPLHLIDGYGLPPEEQRFRKDDIPIALINLEAEAVEKAKKDASSNKNSVVTLHKIQKAFWELLYSRKKELKKDINFIRKVWWHRLNGFWFFNNGKPCYITGWHYFYLNFWSMDVERDGKQIVGSPDYRERDMKEFVFKKYAHTTTETFARLDKEGYAIKEDDGSYLMRDVGRRICFGVIQPKNRRSGNTNKMLSDGMELVTRTLGTDGMGIISFSEDNSRSHFKDKLMPSFNRMPIWIKPNSTSGRTSDVLKFDVGKNVYGELSLGNYCDYATTSSSKFYDGKKKIFLATDESGKTKKPNVSERHEVNKHVVAQGNGAEVFGFLEYPSTVENITDGAHHYRDLADSSNFYNRNKTTGQSASGLFLIFVSGAEGLDKYVDSHGNSVAYSISESQKREGFTETASEFLQSDRDFLQSKGDQESMRAYRHLKQLFPLQYDDCWGGQSGDLGLDIEKIDNQLAVLRRGNDVIRCNYEWKDEYGGEVVRVIDMENGRFVVSKEPPEYLSNKKTLVKMYSTFDDEYVNMWKPLHAGVFTLGADPFQFSNKQAAQDGISLGHKSRLSDGGIAIIWNYDEGLDGGKSMEEWESYRFVLSYRYRPANSREYNEDVLKAAIYYGAMVFPETNIKTTYEYFIENKFGGYLLYGTDGYSGKLKDKPGMDSLERSKQELFNLWRDYVDFRCHKEQHEDILRELKTIKGIEQMRFFDLVAAGGMALIGAKNTTYVNAMNRLDETDTDLGNFYGF